MPGFVSNPYPWYRNAKLFVLSSDIEGFGNVVVEALACNVPVISTDCGPVVEILKRELSKGIVAKDDCSAMSDKINEYLINPILPTQESIESFSFENVVTQQRSLI